MFTLLIKTKTLGWEALCAAHPSPNVNLNQNYYVEILYLLFPKTELSQKYHCAVCWWLNLKPRRCILRPDLKSHRHFP